MKNNIKKLAEMLGVASSFVDGMGKNHRVTDETRRPILESMGYNLSSDNKVEKYIEFEKNHIWKKGMDATISLFIGMKEYIYLHIPANLVNEEISYNFEIDGKIYSSHKIRIKKDDIIETHTIKKSEFVKLKLNLKIPPDMGYYNLNINIKNLAFNSFIILAPHKAYLPDMMKGKNKKRVLGLILQLYALRSNQNMGIGDFNDLKNIVKYAAELGYDAVGINPLGATHTKSPSTISPYGTLSREFISYAYIDLQSVEDFKKSKDIKKLQASPKYKTELKYLREVDKVDYYAMFQFKLKILKKMYVYFKKNHLQKNTYRAKQFINFKKLNTDNLNNLCVFETILEQKSDHWINWKNNYDNINSPQIFKFKNSHKNTIDFYAYTHWLADFQLNQINKLCKTLKMKIGLYMDMPIGAFSNSAEVWQNTSNFALEMDIGCPPGSMNPKGQNWGQTPYNPTKFKENHYSEFISLVKNNMKYAGAIRIDHAFGLMRLYWDNKKAKGTYIKYPLQDLFAITILESHKNNCIVIGEDLGNAPDGFGEYMQKHNFLSNKILFYQKDSNGDFIAPSQYTYLSLAQVSTHDLPTSYGFWFNNDIYTNEMYKLYPKSDLFKNALKERYLDKINLLKAMKKEDIFYNNKENLKLCLDGKSSIPFNLEYNFNMYISKTASAMCFIRIEDIYQQIVLENLPGTSYQYPNWKIKLAINVDDMKKDGRMKEITNAIKKMRP